MKQILFFMLALITNFSYDGEQKEPTKKSIAFYLQNGVEILDFAGPMEVFAYAGHEIFTVSLDKKLIKSQGILKIEADYTIDNAPKADIVAFFGGNSSAASKNKKVINWVKMQSPEYYFSVCTGAFVLAEAGILDGKTATTFHNAAQLLEEKYSKINVLKDVRYVDNGNIITTAGVSAGIDGALHLVAKLQGLDKAKQTARYMEYDKWIPGEGVILSEDSPYAQRSDPSVQLNREINPEKSSNSNNEITPPKHIKKGAGEFKVEGGFIKTDSVTIHYYRPHNFKNTSPVIFVLPGGGRNGDDYRDSWIKKAEDYGVLVLSPEYNEKNYPEFWNYNLAGMYKDVVINKERTAVESYRISDNPDEWIFNDFDRVFEMVKNELDLRTDTYDMFGHSAGGQILHRFAIFHPNNKANRILAANSGWYTLATDSEDFPYGLKNTVQTSKYVNFNSNLILFLGEKDDANEKRGSLRRSPEADEQGLHRLARGNYFFNTSRETAVKLKKSFNWEIEIINGIGHDYRKMGEAAADYLYGK